jgi:CheY-like chemotaxis protein
VLVVDDSADVRAIWREWLAFWSFDVEEAENGVIAVQKARDWRPALIIMDLTMPVLDGVSATHMLKDDPGTADIPVLALSADVMPPSPQRALEAGCDVFIPKPVRAVDLLCAMRAAFRRAVRARLTLDSQP